MLERETMNKLFLELSQFATAKTKRELELEHLLSKALRRQEQVEDLLRSAHNIALREGKNTAWQCFANSVRDLGIGSVTARVYVLNPDETEDKKDGPATPA